mgnify:CR=1 FL=1
MDSNLKKIVYFDRETINNALQRQNRGLIQNTQTQSSNTSLDAKAHIVSDFSASLNVPFLSRLKFLFNGKLKIDYLREWDSRTTVTSTDISQFQSIEENLTSFSKVQLYDVKNSLTSFRVAATFSRLVRTTNQDFNVKEASDLLSSMEGYDLYDIKDKRYVRFNQNAYLSNYKRNDISMSILDLYCVKVGTYDLDDFDYLKKLNSMQSLFDISGIQAKTLDDIYFEEKNPDGSMSSQTNTSHNENVIALYDVLCAYVSEQQ